jgi:hypothetical protein
MPPRKSNRMAFGSYHVTPPPVTRPRAVVPRDVPGYETKEDDAGAPDLGNLSLDPRVPYNETVAPPYVAPIEPFAPRFAALIAKVPLSVRTQLIDRLSRKQYDVGSSDPEVGLIIEKAVASYEKKKKSGAVAAAARRAKAKAARQAATSAIGIAPTEAGDADEADEADDADDADEGDA